MRRRINYANITATVALFFAMSGGALAAKRYLLNSTKQINPKVLRALKGKAGPTGPAGVNGGNGSPGVQGKEGPAGKEGKPGPTILGAITIVRSPEVFVPKGQIKAAVAECPKGSRAISGGYEYFIDQTEKPPNTVKSEATAGRKGWFVEAGNPLGNTESLFEEAVAYCAKEGEAIGG